MEIRAGKISPVKRKLSSISIVWEGLDGYCISNRNLQSNEELKHLLKIKGGHKPSRDYLRNTAFLTMVLSGVSSLRI